MDTARFKRLIARGDAILDATWTRLALRGCIQSRYIDAARAHILCVYRRAVIVSLDVAPRRPTSDVAQAAMHVALQLHATVLRLQFTREDRAVWADVAPERDSWRPLSRLDRLLRAELLEKDGKNTLACPLGWAQVHVLPDLEPLACQRTRPWSLETTTTTTTTTFGDLATPNVVEEASTMETRTRLSTLSI